MVTFKCNVYNEDEETGKIIGAEVIVYNDTGDLIDTIEITDAERLQELESKLEVLDSTYLTYDEVIEILSNSAENIIINATLLNGLASDDFAKKDHTHNEYAPLAHTKELGSKTVAGHVKTIDNLNTVRYVTGEALSAYQGKLLNDRINKLDNQERTFQTMPGESNEHFALIKSGNVVIVNFNHYEFKNMKVGTFNDLYTPTGEFACHMHNIYGFYDENVGRVLIAQGTIVLYALVPNGYLYGSFVYITD